MVIGLGFHSSYPQQFLRTNLKNGMKSKRVPKDNPNSTCPNCGYDVVFVSIHSEIYRYGDDESAVELPVDIPVYTCESCGFQFTDWEAEEIKHKALCQHYGVLNPTQILSIRKKLRMSRKRFAEITGIGEASLARWEKGINIQNPAMDRYLRLLNNPDNFRRLLNQASTNDSPPDEAERNVIVFPHLKLDDALRQEQLNFSLRFSL